MARETAPFGSWRSPITPSMITSSGISASQIATHGESLFWLENRPLEHGRGVVVRRRQGTIEDLTPAAFNVRTRAHEYGGGSFWVHEEALFFANFGDQRLYRRSAAGECEPITPEPDVPAADRYADGCVTPDGCWTICIRETHADRGEARNEVVILPTDGSALPRTLVAGNDFYAFPRLHPDGTRLAWVEWSHPSMPWDGTELWVADLDPEREIAHATRVAGGTDESIFQPRWSPRGDLHFVSDRTGWWNLYAVHAGEVSLLCAREAEFGGPQWGVRAEPLRVPRGRHRGLLVYPRRVRPPRFAASRVADAEASRDAVHLASRRRIGPERSSRPGLLPGRLGDEQDCGYWPRPRERPRRGNQGLRLHGNRPGIFLDARADPVSDARRLDRARAFLSAGEQGVQRAR